MKAAWEAFKAVIPPNLKQREFIHKAMRDESGYMALQGPPGTGKSFALSVLVLLICLHGKCCIATATTNAAADALGAKILNVYRFLPNNIKKTKKLVFMPKLSNLNSIDLFGLLKKRKETLQNRIIQRRSITSLAVTCFVRLKSCRRAVTISIENRL